MPLRLLVRRQQVRRPRLGGDDGLGRGLDETFTGTQRAQQYDDGASRGRSVHGAQRDVPTKSGSPNRLEGGVRSEYRKAGGICPLDARGPQRELDGGMESFVSAFARR